VDIANPGLSLLTGMYAQVHLHLTRSVPSLILPATALVIRSSGTEVMVVDDAARGQPATIHLRPVVVGRDFGGTVEIESGLEDGIRVVSNPNADLMDGMRVIVAAPPAEQPAPGTQLQRPAAPHSPP
jgi:multidrug efflux pump subunit AcrA (membrane-fusion protein)